MNKNLFFFILDKHGFQTETIRVFGNWSFISPVTPTKLVKEAVMGSPRITSETLFF